MNSKKNIKVHNKSILFLLISLVLISFSSCKDECDKCNVPPDLTKIITFNLNNHSFQDEFQIYQMKLKNGNYREAIFEVKTNENLYNFIKDFCQNQNVSINSQTISIVLYYKSPVTQNFIVNDENVKGISIYCVENKKIMHHLFVRNVKNIFIEEENTKVAVSWISHNHIQFYLEHYVFDNPNNNSYIIFSNELTSKVWKNRKKYRYVPFRLELKSTTKEETKPQECYGPCPSPGSGGCITITTPGGIGLVCESECTFVTTQSILTTENLSESTFINLNLMHSFRDDFLSKYSKGEEYINNYYLISSELKDNISIPLALKTAVFFSHFNSVMAAFVNPENHLNEILFTENLTQELLDLLDDYEEIISSSEGRAIISSIRNDINSFKNKTLQEILSMIN